MLAAVFKYLGIGDRCLYGESLFMLVVPAVVSKHLVFGARGLFGESHSTVLVLAADPKTLLIPPVQTPMWLTFVPMLLVLAAASSF